MTPPTEPQAEELLEFQRKLQEYARAPRKELKGKLTSQVRSIATKERRSEKASHYALQLVKVLYDLNDIKGALIVATFISTESDRLALQRHRKRQKNKKPVGVEKQEPKIQQTLPVSAPIRIPATPAKLDLKPPPAKSAPLAKIRRRRSFISRKFLNLVAYVSTFLPKQPKP